jgi:hypothetical protein
VQFFHHASGVGVADCRGGLATFIGAAACSFTGLIKGILKAEKSLETQYLRWLERLFVVK